MKYLSIIRHAKTEPPAGYARDFDRPLTTRGHKDTRLIGALLQSWKPSIDWLVSSTAVRAYATTEILAETLGYAQKPAWRDELYAATPETIREVLAQSPAQAEHVGIVAHNPGLEELAASLCASAPARLNLLLPTCGVVHLRLEIARWDQLRWGCAQLEFYIRPKLLRPFS